MATKKKVDDRLAIERFPPYGYMNDVWAWDIETRRVPVGLLLNGSAASPQEWRDWIETNCDDLAKWLWPRYDTASGQWQGQAAAAAVALTTADLEVMKSFDSTLTAVAELDGKPLGPTHMKLFEDEDEPQPGQPRYPSLDHYVPGLSSDRLDALKEAIKAQLSALGPVPLRFKEVMQRPRPQQVAFLWNLHWFHHQHARSAVSPSLPSGHAMQGLLGRCGGYLRSQRDLQRVGGAVAALEQYAIDIGDRRVYAGVHYPSDNVASWIIALRMAGPLFGNAGMEAHAFIVRSIQRSKVLAAMRAQADASPVDESTGERTSPFVSILTILDDEMQRRPGRQQV